MRDDSSRGSRRLFRLKHARTNGTVDVLASTGPRWQKLRRAWINACRGIYVEGERYEERKMVRVRAYVISNWRQPPCPRIRHCSEYYVYLPGRCIIDRESIRSMRVDRSEW
ncbi:hypothetical protein ALC53_09576 [Atta colombica]|uniref:Uncharacterized protein n=1 Tax=Atta colombica TaxID=520822 RepID=A0A195B715_9HYME|nr:hypothetical protein ALC53_09576 [Atta colombica]